MPRVFDGQFLRFELYVLDTASLLLCRGAWKSLLAKDGVCYACMLAVMFCVLCWVHNIAQEHSALRCIIALLGYRLKLFYIPVPGAGVNFFIVTRAL